MCNPFVAVFPYLSGWINAMIRVAPDIAIHEKELTFDFVRSSGPGGQNVNKVATTVQLRFDVEASDAIPLEVKKRLKRIAGKRMTDDGMLIIKAGRFRKQEQNRQDALERLVRLLRAAAVKPKKRIETRPSKAAKERKLAAKKHRGQLKKLRKKITNGE
jgi:ribosome-associated protein